MTRLILNYLLPLIFPMLLYGAWNFLVLRQRRRAQQAADAAQNKTSEETQHPWFWLIVAGFVLMVAGLVVEAFLSGNPPDGEYHPPRYEDGKVIPGVVIPPEGKTGQ